MILEFKARNPRKEASLEDTLQAARRQIEEKQYEAAPFAKGFAGERIHKYGFAFDGERCIDRMKRDKFSMWRK